MFRMGRPPSEEAEEQLLDTLRRLCGDAVANRFHDAFAGLEIYVPGNVRIDHPIALAIGLDAARKLSAECGDCRYAVPSNRTRRVALLVAEGRNNPEIARELGLTVRGVAGIVSRYGLREKRGNSSTETVK